MDTGHNSFTIKISWHPPAGPEATRRSSHRGYWRTCRASQWCSAIDGSLPLRVGDRVWHRHEPTRGLQKTDLLLNRTLSHHKNPHPYCNQPGSSFALESPSFHVNKLGSGRDDPLLLASGRILSPHFPDVGLVYNVYQLLASHSQWVLLEPNWSMLFLSLDLVSGITAMSWCDSLFQSCLFSEQAGWKRKTWMRLVLQTSSLKHKAPPQFWPQGPQSAVWALQHRTQNLHFRVMQVGPAEVQFGQMEWVGLHTWSHSCRGCRWKSTFRKSAKTKKVI